MTDLDEFTTQQIRQALEAALKAKEFQAAADLICALAVREPDEAALISALIYANS